MYQHYRFDLLAILLFLGICLVYFSPVLEGKKIIQNDVKMSQGSVKEVIDYHAETGDYALWTGRLFSGMPTYQIWIGYPYNIGKLLARQYRALLPNPVYEVFLYLVGFFIFMRTCRVNIPLSIIGAIAFAFSTYNIIILEAGHITKAEAIGFFPLIFSGIIITLRGKYLFGGALTALMVALEIACSHLQMTYYLALSILIFMIVHLIYSYKQQTLPAFFKASAVLLLAAIVGVGINISSLWLNYEYVKDTIRGNTELRVDPKANTGGLDKDYAFQYSYGIDESFTLLVPNFLGGASQGSLSQKSESYEKLKANGIPNPNKVIKQLPTYWGDQPFTSGPVYFGAVIMFLFIWGLFIVRGPVKWWVFGTFLLSVMLSWGHHFALLSDLFFDYFPFYNKFRAVSSILSIASLVVPFLAIIAVKDFIAGSIPQEKLFKSFKRTLIAVGGFLGLCVIAPGIFGDFSSENDKQLPEWLIESLVSDRQNMLRMDALRSLVFVLLAGLIIYLYNRQKNKLSYFYIGLGLLVLTDMWAINRRYLNNENFISKNRLKSEYAPAPTQADLQIMQDKDIHYRVFNMTVNPFTDNNTSYYHKSIGGYNAARLKRYQEIIEHHLSKSNLNVINMLNAKYLIAQPQGAPEPIVQLNPEACGNAWFIREIKYVANADSEMMAMYNFDPKTMVIVDQRYKPAFEGFNLKPDSLASIRLTKYEPDKMTYASESSSEQFAVFSEIYYDKGWNAYIDGEKAGYVRVNYLLRGMRIPPGKHEIIFIFEPEGYYVGTKIELAFSSLVILALVLGLFYNRTRKSIT